MGYGEGLLDSARIIQHRIQSSRLGQAQLLTILFFLFLIPTAIILAETPANSSTEGILAETGSIIEIEVPELNPCENITCPDSALACPDGVELSCPNACQEGACTQCEPECTGHEDLCVGILCADSNTTCPDSTELSCPNACDPSTGECPSCIPDCSGHDIVNETSETNETCEELWECTEWDSCLEGEQSRTCTDLNSCGTVLDMPLENQSCSEPEPEPDPEPEICNITCNPCEEPDMENCTCISLTPCCGNLICEEGEDHEACPSDCEPPEPEPEEPEPEPEPPEEPETPGVPILEAEIFSPDQVTRGETITLEAFVENTGPFVARNVAINWDIPFEITTGEATKECGDLEPGVLCASIITVQPSFSAELGPNDIRIVVSYD